MSFFKNFWALCAPKDPELQEIVRAASTPNGKQSLLQISQRLTSNSISKETPSLPFRKGFDKDYEAKALAERRRKYVDGKEGVLTDYVLRYLESCHSDTAACKKAVDTYVALRREHIRACGGKTDEITSALIEKELARNKMAMCTVRGKGDIAVTCVTLVVRRHMRSTTHTTLNEKVCHLLYFLERVVERIEKYGGEFYLIFDLAHLGQKNADMAFTQQIAALQHVYRDIIKKVYCANAGRLFRSIWGIAKPWFSPRIIEKINILGKGSELEKALPLNCDSHELPDLMRAIWDEELSEHLERVQETLEKNLKKSK